VTGGSRCKSDAVPQPWEIYFQVGLPNTFIYPPVEDCGARILI